MAPEEKEILDSSHALLHVLRITTFWLLIRVTEIWKGLLQRYALMLENFTHVRNSRMDEDPYEELDQDTRAAVGAYTD